jgi:dienelactone hydrolase
VRAILLSVAAALVLASIAARAAGLREVALPSLDGRLSIPAYWFPADASGRRPAVVALHGCNGALDAKGRLGAGSRLEAERFNVEGIHYLVPDSLTPRGVKSLCETPERQRVVHDEERREDAFAAIQWLARQPGVDQERIAVIGRSHGAQAILSLLDRTDKLVQRQPIQPRAAVALYPGCNRFEKMWRYEISAPLLVMMGELDTWTPALNCKVLQGRVLSAQQDAVFDLVVYPGSYHAFDALGPVRLMRNLGNARNGEAMVGGNPEAREKSQARMFDFLAARFGMRLLWTHEQRLKGHRYAVPPSSGYAEVADVSAVPVAGAGRERYEHYLGLRPPKAFVVTAKGGWHFSSDDPEAMAQALGFCRAGVACWLYAVDDRVVWQREVSARIDTPRLRRVAPGE